MVDGRWYEIKTGDRSWMDCSRPSFRSVPTAPSGEVEPACYTRWVCSITGKVNCITIHVNIHVNNIRKMSIQAYRTVSSPSIRQHTWWTLRLQTGCCWSLTDGLWSRDRRASLQRRTRGEMMKGGCHHPPDDEGGRFNWPTHVLGTSWPESPVWDCVRTNPHITCLGVPEPLNALTQGHTTTGRIYIDLLCPASFVLNRPTATLGRDSVHVMKN